MGFAIQSQTVRRLREAVTLIGFLGSSVRPIVISLRSFTPASTRAEAVWDEPCRPRALFVTQCRCGPSRCSVAAEALWWFDGLQRAEVEFDDRLQSLHGGALLQVYRQALQPNGVLGLQGGECGDRIVPTLSATAMIGGPADADQRRANDPSGAVSGLAFGGGHGAFAARGTRHRFHSEVLRYGMLRQPPLRQPSVAGKLRRGSLWPRRSAPFCLRGQRPQVCAACG